MNARERRLGLVSVLALFVLVSQSFGTVIYNESFENYQVGAATPAPWNNWYTGNNTVTNSIAQTGSQCVDLAYNGSIGRDSDKGLLVNGKGTSSLSFKDNGWGSPYFMMYIGELNWDGSGQIDYVKLCVNYWGGIDVYNSANQATKLIGGSLGQNWNSLAVSFDTYSGTYDVIYNGNTIGSSIAMFNAPNPLSAAPLLRIRIESWDSANAVFHTYVDDWSLSTVPEPATICLLGLGLGLFRRNK
jgi:hypothetical protein